MGENAAQDPPLEFENDDRSLKYGWVVCNSPFTMWGKEELTMIVEGDELEKRILDSLFVLFALTRKDIEAENAKDQATNGSSKSKSRR